MFKCFLYCLGCECFDVDGFGYSRCVIAHSAGAAPLGWFVVVLADSKRAPQPGLGGSLLNIE